MEFTISWGEDDLIRLCEDYLVLRRKTATLIHKSKPSPSVGILYPREDLEAVIMERIREEGFMPAEDATVTWKTRKGLTAQIRVVGDPDATRAPAIPSPGAVTVPEIVLDLSPRPDRRPVPDFDASMFPPGTDMELLKTAAAKSDEKAAAEKAAAEEAEKDVLRHPITGKAVGTTKDRTTMKGETPAEEKKPNARKKKSSTSGRKRRKKSR